MNKVEKIDIPGNIIRLVKLNLHYPIQSQYHIIKSTLPNTKSIEPSTAIISPKLIF